ncbi:TonB-dependent receptor [Pseudomaricurvus alkylphenolicus]|uniref:TonB-dependent receptor n=1 Tax=Pseudomaricurvus alkylphenolicus TaxID=1306991 RepID=UPI0014238529|nr:TonB-dependent receptor [Pseudomaricurvus alkylphenolicus]NIB38100.1 TonB-dependent receptor [Pseudomaricurvus alkylphenolicus]
MKTSRFPQSLLYTAVMICVGSSPLAWGLDTLQIEEVVVTAQKRAESIQDVPIAISAFSAEELRNTGASSLQDLTDYVSGVELFDDRGSGQPTWVIRGVGLADFNSNNTPTAAIYDDEFYLISNVMGGIGLFDTERVEVLKGPQGGVYGRNTTGGAVRVLSTQPSLDESDGYLTASYGRWGRYHLEGAFGAPISDTVAYRIAAKTEQAGGWQDSLATPGDDEYGDRDFSALKAQLLIQPSDELKIWLKVNAGEDNSETTLGQAVGAYDLNTGGFCGAVQSGRRDQASCATFASLTDSIIGGPGGLNPAEQNDDGSSTLSNPVNELDNSWMGITARIDWDWEKVTLTSITGYLQYDNRFVYDFDATERVFLTENGDAEIQSWSQEFRFTSTSDGVLHWIAGVVIAGEQNDEFRIAHHDDNVLFQAAFSCDESGTVCDPRFPFSSFQSSRGFSQEGESWAVYGQADYELSDTVTVNGSLRYTKEDKELDGGFLNARSNGYFLHQGTSADYELEKNWSGHIGIDWTPTNNSLIYAKATRGFKSGGFYGGFAITPQDLQPYREEVVLAYEVGFKTDWLDRRLRINGSAYFYDYRDVQGFVTGFDETLGTILTKLGNLGDAEHTGVELEAQWIPESVEGLSFAASLAWLDAEFTDSDSVILSQDGTPASVEGLQRATAPEWSYTFQTRYERSIADNLLLGAQLNYSYRSDVNPSGSYAGVLDRGLNPHDGYDLINARVSIGTEEERWSVSLVGRNLANEDYVVSSSTDDLGSFNDVPGLPRSWSVELDYRF